MKRLGYIFSGIGLVLAILTFALRGAISDDVALVPLFGAAISLLIAFLIFIASGISRLARGDIKLRPWDAARKFPTLFAIILGLHLVIGAILPGLKYDILLAVLRSAVGALFFSLYNTAYRKSL